MENIDFGNNGSLSGIQGPVNIGEFGDLNEVFIDDSQDTESPVYTFDANTFSVDSADNIAPITFGSSTIDEVDLSAAPGILNINSLSNTPDLSLSTDDDAVTVSNPTLGLLPSTIEFIQALGDNTLAVDDSGSGGTSATIDESSDGGLWIGFSSAGSIEIDSESTEFSQVTLKGAVSINDAFTVNGEPYNDGNGVSIEIVGGNSTNTFTVNSTSPGYDTTLLGGNSDNTFNIVGAGSGGVAVIQSLLAIDGGGGNSTVNIDDHTPSVSTSYTYTVTSNSITRGSAFDVDYSNVQNVSLSTSAGSDTVDITSTALGSMVTIQGGASNDTYNLGGDGSGSVDQFAGDVTIDGGGGTNTVTFNDHSASADCTYVISNGSLVRSSSESLDDHQLL